MKVCPIKRDGIISDGKCIDKIPCIMMRKLPTVGNFLQAINLSNHLSLLTGFSNSKVDQRVSNKMFQVTYITSICLSMLNFYPWSYHLNISCVTITHKSFILSVQESPRKKMQKI